MELGLLPLPFGWSDTGLVNAHRYAWTFGIFINLMAMFWCMAFARKLQIEAYMDQEVYNGWKYTKAKLWFAGGVALLLAIFLYPVLGLYMLVPIMVVLVGPPLGMILLGICLYGYLMLGELYVLVRTMKDPDWH